MRKCLTLIVAAVAAVILTSACEPAADTAERPATATYTIPPTTAGDPDGPAVDRAADDLSETATAAPTGPRGTLPQFPPPVGDKDVPDLSVSAPTEDSAGMWDADTRGNHRFDPDVFDCETMGNGECDAGGIPVNGPNSSWHRGLPCYLDFDDVRSALSDEQYNYAHALHCSPAL